MKKSIIPMIIGMFVAFALFWVGQPTGLSTVQHEVSELPKKSFAKSDVEIQNHTTVANIELTDEKAEVKTITTVSKTDTEAPNKGDFVKIADTFMNEILQPTDENYKVSNFDTKDELIEYLKQYASKEVTEYYVDGLYEEKADGLYIIPTELPPWIMKGEPSDLTKVDEDHYKLEQENSSDLYGNYSIQLTFSKSGDNWIIESAEVQ